MPLTPVRAVLVAVKRSLMNMTSGSRTALLMILLSSANLNTTPLLDVRSGFPNEGELGLHSRVKVSSVAFMSAAMVNNGNSLVVGAAQRISTRSLEVYGRGCHSFSASLSILCPAATYPVSSGTGGCMTTIVWGPPPVIRLICAAVGFMLRRC